MAASFSSPSVCVSAVLFALTAVKVREWEGRSDFWAGLTVWVVNQGQMHSLFWSLSPLALSVSEQQDWLLWKQ